MGEMLQLTMPGDGTAEAYLTGADGPGVLLFMDAFGLRPQLLQMADLIASWGYVVLAPQVFWRDGTAADLAPTTDLTVPDNRAAFFTGGASDRIRGLTPARYLADNQVWLAALEEHADPGALATVGYCFGGRLALRTAAAHPDRFALLAMFHAGGLVTDDPDAPVAHVPQLRAFVLAGHADQDGSNTAEQVAAFDRALDAAGLAHRTATYPGAPHGFTMADTSVYNEAGARRYETELREALATTLG